MLTVLLYIVIVALVGVLLFLVASVVFGRNEELAALPPGATAAVLPAQDVRGSDVRALRFQQALRGYKASEVDWALARLGTEIDRLRDELAKHETVAVAPAKSDD